MEVVVEVGEGRVSINVWREFGVSCYVRKSVNYSFECCVKRSLQSIAPNVAIT